MRFMNSTFGMAALALLPALAACGSDTTTVDPVVATGAQAYVKFACASCHGLDGSGKTFGTKTSAPLNAYKASDEAAIRAYIENGKGLSTATSTGAVFMPSWANIIPSSDEDAIVAFLLAGLPAVDGVSLPSVTGTDVAAGQKVYESFACAKCHGVGGAGGVTNPGSEDGVIPQLTGAEFKGEFDTAEKISKMIRDGAIIGNPPVTSMPAWGGVLTADQITAVTAYIQSLP